MVILLSNDDGYQSKGIQELKKSLSSIAKVYLVAPDRERSAVSHKITLTQPIRITRLDETSFITDASPADCVKAAFLNIVPEKIDLVVSGINYGPNMGIDVFYSGTVAVAREGVMKGVPGIAFSLNSFHKNLDFVEAAARAPEIVQRFFPLMQPHSLLNVNFPENGPYRGIKTTRLGFRVYKEKLVEQKDPMGMPYYWIGGELPSHEPRKGSDFEAVYDGYVSVTPLTLDITDYRALSDFSAVQENSGAAPDSFQGES